MAARRSPSRHVREYCPHCFCEQWCTFKGWGLYCDARDHFVRSKRAAKRTAPAPQSMYDDVRDHIDRTFKGKGEYDWDELATWCRRAHFYDLQDLCEEMKQFE